MSGGQDLGLSLAADQAARERIRTSLDESLLVEAAAGTGKTTELTTRAVALIASRRTTVDRIVAVTFTRKAAGELALRLRQKLDEARSAATDEDERRALEEALARLEEARIGTIHSFCADLLRERPVEAGIDPGFREMDEVEAGRLFSRAFRSWIERRLDDLPRGLERALARLTGGAASAPGGDGPIRRLEAAAASLVDWRDFPAPWSRRPLAREEMIDRLVEEVASLADKVARCRRNKDPLAASLADFVTFDERRRRAEAVSERDYDVLEGRLVDLARIPAWRRAKKGRGDSFAPGIRRQEVVAERQALFAALDAFRQEADADLAAELRDDLLETVAVYERQKAESGRLDFLDLLIKTRDLLAGEETVRRHYQESIGHLFVDEVQDTDPLQAEILLLLSADDPAENDWRKVRPAAGKLFLVGDPKQSIYRFRRADVVLYGEIKRQLAEVGVGIVHLTRSFRSVPTLQRAVNAAFAPEMDEDPETGQAAYVPLLPDRTDTADQPALVALPVPEPIGYYGPAKGKVDQSIPAAMAAFVAWLVGESGWTIENPDRRGERIPIEPRHIAILFRRYTAYRGDVTRDYVHGLEVRGLPHLLVGGRSFHQREEVETLRSAFSAIEWPDDELSVYATLKGSLFALPDADLFRYRRTVGRLDPLGRRPEDEAESGVSVHDGFGEVVEALDLLKRLHRARNRLPVATTLERLLSATRAHAGFALRPAGAQVLANLARIADLARRYELGGGLSFRGFVERLEEEAARSARVESASLEEGAEGVRLMTVHAAKGLEFPVVLLADPTAKLARAQPEHHVDRGAGLAAHQLLWMTPWDLAEKAELEAARDRAEGLRVAYVAATRARDLLVVPTIGVGPQAEWQSWLSPLDRSLYPEPAAWGAADSAPGCPSFGPASVVASRLDEAAESVRPGLHRPQAGGHPVVWWDPTALALDVKEKLGLRQEEILADDEGGRSDKGLAGYRAWEEERDRWIEQGGRARFDLSAVTRLEGEPPATPSAGEAAPIEIVRVSRPQVAEGAQDTVRPAGLRFGSLVHQLLEEAEPATAWSTESEEALRARAEILGRLAGAPEGETEAAVRAVEAALGHPLLRRAASAKRCHRELPIVLEITADGRERMVEGTIDLAFADEEGWTVVDFKTDAELGERQAAYERQVRWYVAALSRLTGEPVRGVLLLV